MWIFQGLRFRKLYGANLLLLNDYPAMEMLTLEFSTEGQELSPEDDELS